MIEAIHIENFKALKSIDLTELPQLAVFVGKNGVGKTSLFCVFSFLKRCLSYNVRVALQHEGGFKETLENLKVGPHRILTPLSQQGFSKGQDWGGGGFPVFP